MPEENLRAIVLRRSDAGESDRRLTVLSLELGKVDIVAKGAKKPASRLGSASEPLTVAIFGVASGKRNRFITQVQHLGGHRGLRADYDRLMLALSFCELVSAVLPWEEPFPEAYHLLEAGLAALDRHPKPAVALAWAEVALLRVSGFLPEFGSCTVCGKAVAEAQPFVSPMAGGYVSDDCAGEFRDQFRVRAEVLYGLVKLAELAEPPANLKFVEETLADLLPFWKAIAESPLPTNDTTIAELRHRE